MEEGKREGERERKEGGERGGKREGSMCYLIFYLTCNNQGESNEV